MSWAKGIVEWIEGDDAYLSVVFTWDLDEAWTRARWLHHAGYRVHVGGPAVGQRRSSGMSRAGPTGGSGNTATSTATRGASGPAAPSTPRC